MLEIHHMWTKNINSNSYSQKGNFLVNLLSVWCSVKSPSKFLRLKKDDCKKNFLQSKSNWLKLTYQRKSYLKNWYDLAQNFLRIQQY